jgi:hypothetical protein
LEVSRSCVEWGDPWVGSTRFPFYIVIVKGVVKMKNVFLVLLMMGLLIVSGCNSPVSLDKGGNVVIKGEQGEEIKIGEKGMEIKGEDGSKSVFSTGDDVKLPEGYPSNVVPLMKGGKIDWANKTVEDGKLSFWIGVKYNRKSEEVYKFYEELFSGVAGFSFSQSQGYYSLIGVKDGYDIMITITDEEENITSLGIVLGQQGE